MTRQVSRADTRSWPPFVTTVVTFLRSQPVRVLATAVAVISAAATYVNLRQLALLAGEATWVAAIWPVSVFGLMLVALRRGGQGRWWLLSALVVGMVGSAGARSPETVADVAWVVRAWPPIAFFGCYSLVQQDRGPARSDRLAELQ